MTPTINDLMQEIAELKGRLKEVERRLDESSHVVETESVIIRSKEGVKHIHLGQRYEEGEPGSKAREYVGLTVYGEDGGRDLEVSDQCIRIHHQSKVTTPNGDVRYEHRVVIIDEDGVYVSGGQAGKSSCSARLDGEGLSVSDYSSSSGQRVQVGATGLTVANQDYEANFKLEPEEGPRLDFSRRRPTVSQYAASVPYDPMVSYGKMVELGLTDAGSKLRLGPKGKIEVDGKIEVGTNASKVSLNSGFGVFADGTSGSEILLTEGGQARARLTCGMREDPAEKVSSTLTLHDQDAIPRVKIGVFRSQTPETVPVGWVERGGIVKESIFPAISLLSNTGDFVMGMSCFWESARANSARFSIKNGNSTAELSASNDDPMLKLQGYGKEKTVRL